MSKITAWILFFLGVAASVILMTAITVYVETGDLAMTPKVIAASWHLMLFLFVTTALWSSGIMGIAWVAWRTFRSPLVFALAVLLLGSYWVGRWVLEGEIRPALLALIAYGLAQVGLGVFVGEYILGDGRRRRAPASNLELFPGATVAPPRKGGVLMNTRYLGFASLVVILGLVGLADGAKVFEPIMQPGVGLMGAGDALLIGMAGGLGLAALPLAFRRRRSSATA